MKLEWILLAEGFGTSSSGAVTAIGVNQQVAATPTLPMTTKRGVMAHFADSPDSLAGHEIEVTLTVYDPSGKPILVQTAPARMNENPSWFGLTTGMDIFLEVPLRLADYGAHDIALSVRQPGSPAVEGRVKLYVVEPPKSE